jgi:hypothetical protein
MSFNSRDLMIDVLPSHRFDAPARGFAMCGQITANTNKEGGGDEEEKDCGQITAVTTNEPTAATREGLNLALLHQQMRAAMSAGTAAGA